MVESIESRFAADVLCGGSRESTPRSLGVPREYVEFGPKATHVGCKAVVLGGGIGGAMLVPHSLCNRRAYCSGPSRTLCRRCLTHGHQTEACLAGERAL